MTELKVETYSEVLRVSVHWAIQQEIKGLASFDQALAEACGYLTGWSPILPSDDAAGDLMAIADAVVTGIESDYIAGECTPEMREWVDKRGRGA